MTRLFPRSAARQVALVVAVAVVLSNLAVLTIWFRTDPDGPIPPGFRGLLGEAAGIVVMLDHGGPATRTALRDALRPLDATIEDSVPASLGTMPWVASGMRDALRLRGMAAEVEAFALGQPWSGGIILSVRAPGGQHILRFSGDRVKVGGPSLLAPPVIAILLLGTPLLLVLLWLAHRVTRPLTRLAQQAETVGIADDGRALDETGTTEVRHLAQAINRLLARLREDMADRTRLLAGISHDLRTPLTRLHLRIAAIEDPHLSDRLMRDVAAMEALTARSLALLESELRAEPLERLDLAALAQTVADCFADSGHAVTYSGPNTCPLRGQPHALERALSNLVENAVRHAGAAQLRLTRVGDVARLSVLDDGPGIAEADLPHVTQPFRRAGRDTARSEGGHGLGLAIVAGVARAHGGTLHLANRVPRGLEASLLLPAGV